MSIFAIPFSYDHLKSSCYCRLSKYEILFPPRVNMKFQLVVNLSGGTDKKSTDMSTIINTSLALKKILKNNKKIK